jgi:hypothetical protein
VLLDNAASGPQKKPLVLDDAGYSIPDEALKFWHRRQEVQDILTAISDLKSQVLEGRRALDPQFLAMGQNTAINLEAAYTHASQAKPFAVCTQCMGTPSLQPTGCGLCHGTGMISKHTWNHVSREEVKKLRAKENAQRK